MRELPGPFNDQVVKDTLKVDKTIAEKLNEFFLLVFNTEHIRLIPKPDQFFLADGSQDLDYTEVTTEVLEQKTIN